MWELYCEESWVPKNWCFWTMVLEKTLENSLDCKEIQPVHPKGNQSWIFIGRTDAENETSVFGHLMWKTDLFEKTLMLGKIEGRMRRGWQRMRWLDGITAPTQWTWVWVNFGSWWWTGRPDVPWCMGSQRVGHYWATELMRAHHERSKWPAVHISIKKGSPLGDQCASKGVLLPFLMLFPGRTTSISFDYSAFLYFYFQESPTPKF